VEPIVELEDEKLKKNKKHVKVTQKTKLEPQNDNKKQLQYEVSDGVVSDNNIKLDDEKTKKQTISLIENVNMLKVDEKEKTKKKRLTKNEIYKSDQDKVFEELKKLINVKKNGSFTSRKIGKKTEEITGNILEKFKKYYDTNMSKGIDGKDIKASIVIVKKIFNYHGYDIIGQEYKKVVGNNVKRGTKYVMFLHDTDSDSDVSSDDNDGSGK
jgi:hypothetical protein